MNKWVETWLEFCREESLVPVSRTEPLFMESLSDEEMQIVFSVFKEPRLFIETFERTYCDRCGQMTPEDRSQKVIDLAFASASALGDAIYREWQDERFLSRHNRVARITNDFDAFALAQNTNQIAVDFLQYTGDLVDFRIHHDRISQAYYSACFYINNNLLLQSALAIPVMGNDENGNGVLISGLQDYLSVWSLGASYAFLEESLLVFISDECPKRPFWKSQA